MTALIPHPELRHLSLQALTEPDSTRKVALVQQLHGLSAIFSIASDEYFQVPGGLPGCPAKPELHSHLDVRKRSPFTTDGLAALLHAVTHIEFNAINLALDAVWRFSAMPHAYYLDWLQVAVEEAHHFSLLRAHLQTMGYDYGDFPAHTGLWDMTARTSDDVLARMALVPRTLEARGLDATPQIQVKLRKANTPRAREAVAILHIILADEIGHVAIGNHWYRWLCRRDGLDPLAHYAVLHTRHAAPRLKPPFNHAARLQAGFTAEELQFLQEMV